LSFGIPTNGHAQPMHPQTPPPSSFETLIEDLFGRADRQDEAPKPSHQFSINSLEAAWELAAQARAMPHGADRDGEGQAAAPAYGYDRNDAARDVSLDPAKIVGELGLRAGASDADITLLRREFALRNHPDRVPAELRDVATQRMMIANDLIDRYVAELRKARG
jgi:hypothetical protein